MILRLVAAAMLWVFVHGLKHTRPWEHPAWTHESWERFIVAMCATAVVVLGVHRWWFYLIVLVLACSVGVQPVMGLGFVLLGALNLGWLLFRRDDDRLNLLGGFALYVWAFSLTAGVAINTAWFWGVLLAVPIALGRRFRLPLPQPALPVALPLVANFLLVLKPEVSADGLSQHFVIVQWVKDHARFHFDAANHIWSVQPMAGDWALTLANLFGGEYAARMLNFVWLLVIVSFVYGMLRRRLKTGPAALVTGIFAATPLLQLTSTSMFIENFWSAMIVGALVAIDSRAILLAAAMAGAAGASKLLGLTPAPVLAIFALWKIGRPAWVSKRVLAAVAIFFAIAVVPYARAYWITGNPVFHYANAFFKSPLMWSDRSFADPRYPARLSWRTLYEVTFQTNLFVESEPGTAGYQWLWFLPLGVIGWRRASAMERAALATGLFMIVLVFSRQASLRYVEAALPLFVIAFAAAAAALVQDRWLRHFAGALGVVILGLNLFQMPASGGYHRDFCLLPFSAKEREQYILRLAPVRPLIDVANRVASGAPVAYLVGDEIAGLRGPAWCSDWHTPKFAERLTVSRSVADFVRLMRDFHVEYMIAPRPGHWLYIKDSPLNVFIETATDPVAMAGVLQLVKLRPAFNELDIKPAGAGTYDDASTRITYVGPWYLDQAFAEPAGHTISYSADLKSAVRFKFEGNRITYYFTKASNRGIARIEIDGVAKGLVDEHSVVTEWQAHVTFDHLGGGEHTIVIRHAGPPDKYIDVDQFVVE